jgi:hypothetical protein
MQPTAAQDQTVVVTGLSNREFLELHARPGRIGLSGGITFIDRAICRAERHLDQREQMGLLVARVPFPGPAASTAIIG